MTTFDKGTYQTLLTSDEKFIDTYYNYSHNSTITPFPWLNNNVNISHEESISPIPGQENKVEDREGYNIVQLANDAALEYLNAPSFIYLDLKEVIPISDCPKQKNEKIIDSKITKKTVTLEPSMHSSHSKGLTFQNLNLIPIIQH